jgi:hypothetical protein
MATTISKANMSSYCFYYMQGSPGEAWSSPNAFQFLTPPSASSPARLQDCKMSFPLMGEGKYHWRFREAIEGGFIWRDVGDDDASVLPRYQGVVFAKILRTDKLPRVAPSKIRYNAQRAARPASSSASHSQPHSQPQQREAAAPPASRPAPYSDSLPPRPPAAAAAPAPPPAPAPAPAPPRKPETRAERTQREYKEKAAKQKKVWDPVDERWVVVSDNKSGTSPKQVSCGYDLGDIVGAR